MHGLNEGDRGIKTQIAIWLGEYCLVEAFEWPFVICFALLTVRALDIPYYYHVTLLF
jgi:hypothetical protein